MPVLVEISPAKWDALREAWRRMLEDRPHAYPERWSTAREMTPRAWRQRARELTRPGSWAHALRENSGRFAGFAAAYLDEETPERHVFLTHLHVVDDAAGGALAARQRLVEALVTWAEAQGAEAIVLEVGEHDSDLLDAYARCGFVATGWLRESDFGVAREVELALPLACGAGAPLLGHTSAWENQLA